MSNSETEANPEFERIAHEFESFQKNYFDNVDSLFHQGNKPRGKAAFASWEREFKEFLVAELPGYEAEYQKHLSTNTGSALLMLTEHQNWKLHKGEAVESFLEQSILDARSGSLSRYISNRGRTTSSSINKSFVDQSRIAELRRVQSSDFDLSRLIRICEELNDCASSGSLYAIAALTRSLIDHVPPIFGQSSFSGVASSYSGSRSFKESMSHLDTASRKVADAGLHTQIRKTETLPTPTQVNFSQEIDVLLAEIVRVLK